MPLVVLANVCHLQSFMKGPSNFRSFAMYSTHVIGIFVITGWKAMGK